MRYFIWRLVFCRRLTSSQCSAIPWHQKQSSEESFMASPQKNFVSWGKHSFFDWGMLFSQTWDWREKTCVFCIPQPCPQTLSSQLFPIGWSADPRLILFGFHLKLSVGPLPVFPPLPHKNRHFMLRLPYPQNKRWILPAIKYAFAIFHRISCTIQVWVSALMSFILWHKWWTRMTGYGQGQSQWGQVMGCTSTITTSNLSRQCPWICCWNSYSLCFAFLSIHGRSLMNYGTIPRDAKKKQTCFLFLTLGNKQKAK